LCYSTKSEGILRNKILRALYDKGIRRRLLKQGMCCGNHGVQAIRGKTYCENCLIKKRLISLRASGVPAQEIEHARQAWLTFDGRCWACGSSKPGTKGWTTDHDDEELKFRGILCSTCNLALGYVRDSVIRLKSLMVYLTRSKNER
jgi:Recombination endonuclease VII